nr:hemolysin III, putative [Entamoeba invadens]BAN40461.1 hemolysin III, putative [Entamoeba invadens]BAN41367.1 hemolysin III, putative [Entamoeba invadens]BAN42139.1 hemolysin III, putative [Entamoeba invadens]BAN42183.1 hemolysin III, putative [Entamoeba invadens]
MCILCDLQYYRNQLSPLDERSQTTCEEVFNCLTHVFGILFAIFQMKAMFRLCGRKGFSTTKKTAVMFFCISSLVLYSNSTLYHLFNLVTPQFIRLRYIFQRLDHLTIYLMITGCYVSFILSRLFEKGYVKSGIVVICSIAVMAITGILFTLFSPPTSNMDVIMYLCMGFSCILVAPGWFYFCPTSLLLWLFTGGITYFLGTLFFSWDKLYLNHTIWHIVVLLANIQHSFAVLIAIDDEGQEKSNTFWSSFSQPVVQMKDFIVERFFWAERVAVERLTSQKEE